MIFLPSEPWVLPIAIDETRGVHKNREGWLFDRVCAPHHDVRIELVARGFVFRDKPQQRVLREILHDSAGLLALTPRLNGAVRAAVSEIVLLRARPAFDISHSEPRWPHTIFISVPSRLSEVGALRAVENIIHEAMHLQLTIWERAAPLILDHTSKMASPWRKEPRHFQGVMHGFYVFRCIDAFFYALAESGYLDMEGIAHVRKRREQITEELSGIDYDQLAKGMTPVGRDFLATFIRIS